MLTRTGASKFSVRAGNEVVLVCQSRNNNGTHQATFQYDGNILATETINSRPGCRFTALADTKMFRAIAVFDPAASAAAYDLLEVDPAGNFQPLGETKTAANPVFVLRIQGQAVAVAAPAAGPASLGMAASRAAAPAPAPPKPAPTAPKAVSRTAGPKKAARKKAKKPARKAPARAAKARKPAKPGKAASRKAKGATRRPR